MSPLFANYLLCTTPPIRYVLHIFPHLKSPRLTPWLTPFCFCEPNKQTIQIFATPKRIFLKKKKRFTFFKVRERRLQRIQVFDTKKWGVSMLRHIKRKPWTRQPQGSTVTEMDVFGGRRNNKRVKNKRKRTIVREKREKPNVRMQINGASNGSQFELAAISNVSLALALHAYKPISGI